MQRSVLAGGGEMGALMRQVDWSRTPVGPIHTWPQSLCTAVSIVLESKFGMMIAWGPELIQFYNDQFRPILGATKHPACGKSVRETFPEAWHIIGPLFDQVMQGHSVGFEDMLVPLDRNGYLEECYFLYSYSPIRDESGGVGGIHVTVNETTARVIAERRLRTLRDLASLAGQSSGEADAWVGAGNVLAANPADLPFAGLYAVDESGGAAQLVACHGDRALFPAELPLTTAGVWPLDARAAAGELVLLKDVGARVGERVGSAWPEPVRQAVVLPVTRPSLSQPYGFLVTGVSPRRALDGSYRDFFRLVADQISTAVANRRAFQEERERAESLLRARSEAERALEQLQAADQRKDEFLATLAHELRNPMSAISAALSLLERAGSDQGSAARYREIARRQMTNLVRLVDDLLDVARITRGKVELRKSAVDLAVVVQHAVASARPLIEAREHLLDVRLEPGTFPMQADATRLEQVIVNLLINAAKYTDPGGKIAVELRRELGDAAGHGVVSVLDNGRGIPRAMLDQVFDLFTQVSPTLDRSTGGLGLGLTLCKHLTEMHGGSISAASDGPGRGSEFRLRLPLTAAVEVAEPAEPPSATPAVRRHRILIVEDSEDAREMLKEYLQARGHEVYVAANGAEGVARVAELSPGVALVDLGLPAMDGYEVARRIRAQPRGNRTFLAALTGYGGDNIKQMTAAAGFDIHLTKPVDLTALCALLDSLPRR